MQSALRIHVGNLPWVSKMTLPLTKQVELAQAGDEEATLALLEAFGWREKGRWYNFLGKYDKLLWHGRLDMKNKESRWFIQLFIKDPEVRRRLQWSRQNYHVTMSAQETANFLQDLVREHYTREELRQELTCYFLELVQNYQKRPQINFAGYLMGYFRYRVYWLLHKRLFKYDLFMLQERLVLDDVPFIDPGFALKDLEKDPLLRLEEANDTLGIFWVNGRCSAEFEALSTLERMILRDWYLLNETDTQIAKKYGYHRNSILTKRHKAIAKLKT